VIALHPVVFQPVIFSIALFLRDHHDQPGVDVLAAAGLSAMDGNRVLSGLERF
jgi:hypothetical protein